LFIKGTWLLRNGLRSGAVALVSSMKFWPCAQQQSPQSLARYM
jgi:hypothetical protein